MNKTKKNLHWYDGHLGALYYSENKLSEDKLFCEECGDWDRYIDNYNTWKNAYLGLIDTFKDNPDNYDSQEEYEEYYDPEYCVYDKKYICEVCNRAYGPITIEDFIDIMGLKDKKILINVRLWDNKTFREDEIDGEFAGYFVIEKGKYKFKSNVDSEEWNDLWKVPIKWFEHWTESIDPNQLKEYEDAYIICFEMESL